MPKGVYPRKPRPQKNYPGHIVEKVRELYSSGYSQAEVGAEIGLSQKVVHSLMKRHDLKARVAAKRNQFGSANHAWKGPDAGIQAMHRRLYARFGKPALCSVCRTTDAEHYDYANLSGNYQDIADYAPMCRSCHWKNDKKIENIKHMRERNYA